MDFSSPSRAASVIAASLADQLDATIRFVTVLDVSDLRVAMKARIDRFTTSSDLRKAVEVWVERQYESLSLPEGVSATHVIRRGFAEQEIVAEIARSRADLVVMGSSGLARRLPLGSKTAEVLRRSRVPVVVCPPGTSR